jgi:serine/threonine protein phosphatase 1
MSTFAIGDVHGRREQLAALLQMIPRNPQVDQLVLLGDLIDRGPDAPGVVSDVLELCARDRNAICLRGNHEQMLLNFLDEGSTVWLNRMAGGDMTFEQYTKQPLFITSAEDLELIRWEARTAIPNAHIDFMRELPYFYEDEYAIYVHAGLDLEKHPADTNPHVLLWSRNKEFFTNYHGKVCVFGHTPTVFLPLLGRIGRHGIYLANSAIGIDTGYTDDVPLTCLQLPDLYIYQAFADGHTETHRLVTLLPDALRSLRLANPHATQLA